MNESVFVEFKSEEERLAALRKMVGLRKVWEARVRELMAKHPKMIQKREKVKNNHIFC